MLCAFATGLMFTWSYFREPLSRLFPTWTSADLSAIFSFHNTAVCVTMILTGLIAKKVSPRIRILIGAILIGAGFGSYPFLPTDDPGKAFIMAVVFFTIIAAAGVGLCSTTWIGTFVLWAPDRPGMMVGCMLLVYSCCPIIYGAIASVLIPVTGVLATMRTIGIISTVIFIACLPFVRMPEPEDGLPAARVSAANRNDKSFSPLQLLKTPIFWAMFLFNIFMRSAGLIFADHNADIALSFGIAALFGLIYSPAQGIAGFVSGALVDKFGSPKTMRLFSCILLAASVLLYFSGVSGAAVIALAGLIGTGFAFGGTSAANSSTIRMFFGAEYYTQNYSISTFSIFFASGFCYIAGLIVDRMEGSYYGVYMMALIFGAAAFACTIWLAACVKKEAARNSINEE